MTGENLHDLGYGDDFLDATSKVWYMKKIMNKLDFIKIKTLLCEKRCQENEKTSYRLGENICRRYTDRALLFKIYKELFKTQQ